MSMSISVAEAAEMYAKASLAWYGSKTKALKIAHEQVHRYKRRGDAMVSTYGQKLLLPFQGWEYRRQDCDSQRLNGRRSAVPLSHYFTAGRVRRLPGVVVGRHARCSRHRP